MTFQNIVLADRLYRRLWEKLLDRKIDTEPVREEKERSSLVVGGHSGSGAHL